MPATLKRLGLKLGARRSGTGNVWSSDFPAPRLHRAAFKC